MPSETFVDCEDNKGLSSEDLFKKMVFSDADSDPVLNTTNKGIGSPSDSEATTDTGSFSLISLFKRLLSKLTTGIYVSGKIAAIVENEHTRPNDTNAYTANDVINNATSSATNQSLTNVATENAGSGYMTVVLETDSTAITPSVRIHFYDAAPATAKNDNAAWVLVYADKSKYLGYIDMPALNGGVASGQFKSYKAASASRTLYYELQTLTAFTPVAQSKWNVRVIPDQNNA